MDDIQNYTDKLRKTYRQSLDVVLPFTNHEVVVYCNDDEFDSYLEEEHSVKDLQACIYLLERHIDLQQETIRGLTHLQEVHKFDEKPAEYNIITDKLLTAQDKLAVLRSRTVRCLTKQIQQRCGDANLQLPRWSADTDKEMINDPRDSFINTEPYLSEAMIPTVTPHSDNPSNGITSIIKSDNLSNTIYQNFNGFEKTYEDDDVFEKNNTQSGHNVLRTPSRNVYENNEQKLKGDDSKPCSQFLEEQKPSQAGKTATAIDSDHLKDTFVSGSPEESTKTNTIVESHSNTSQEQDNSAIANDKGLQLFLNVSNFDSGEIDEDTSRVASRHVLEPVEERVTVEVLQSKSRGGVSEKAPEQTVYSAPKIDGDSITKTTETSADCSDSMLNSESENTSPKNNAKTLNWDPSLLLRKVLGKVKPINTEQLESTDFEEIHMAGYLEKLPVNQKKASLLKSWRKRYFKILHGKLFYFEDHRVTAPIGFIRLGGCKVFEMGNKCLEVAENEDLGGKSVMIRCGTWQELQDWRKALENEAKMKVKRQHFELVQEKKPVVIIDFGSSSIKAGFLEDQAWPQVLIPSVYAVNKEDSKVRFYGYEALRPYIRNISKLVYPLRSPLTVGKYLLDPNDLIGFLEIIFKELQVDPSQCQVVMTTPVNLRDQDKERLVEILFDYFQVATVYMKCQAILSLYSYSATCGIVVNIGDHIDVVPVEEGYIVESGMKTLPYGGRLVTDHFARLLSSSGYRYFSEVENYIAEYLKVKTCYIPKDFSKETEVFSESDHLTVDMSEFDLPSGDKFVTVAKERFTAFEGLFRPELWGKDTPGLPDLVYDAVMACSIDSRKEMCRNIYLSGASTKIPGFAERLQTELSRKFPSSLVIQVHAAADRQFAAFIGAAVLSSLETFADLCIGRGDWEETGPELLRKWDGI